MLFPEPPVQRRRRPVALIVIATLVIAAAGAAYLRPTSATQPPRTPVPTIDPLMVSSNPVTYVFVTPTTGWASLIIPSSGQFRIFRTTDGAKHWRQQLAGQSTFGFGFSPITVQLFGKERGFMVIGQRVQQLYRTEDGGSHWESLVLPVSRIDAITFVDSNYGWSVGYAGSEIPANQAHLYATSDAGHTWHQLPDPPADAIDLGLGGPNEAWMGSSDAQLPHVYTSTDRGQSWRRHDLPPAVGSRPDDRYSQTTIHLLPKTGAVASVEAFRCTFLVAPSPGSSTPICVNASAETYLFTSVDVGITWRPVPSPPGDVAYQDSAHWWAVGGNAVFKSTDGGRSWRRVATIPTNLQFSFVDILDSTHAWASLYVMGGYGLALTHDGGLHWALAKVPQPA